MSDTDVMPAEESSGGNFLAHIPAILWERIWLIIVPTLLLTAAGVALAILLPATYRSSATLLVVSQELPSAMVSANSGAIIDKRIAKIRQQVLSRGDLIALIQQLDLYPEERRSKPLSTVVFNMQKAINVAAVDNDIGQSQSQSGESNTIAFSMSFDYRDPAKAQAVMQNLVGRFLDIDSTNSIEEATNTVSFLQDQAKKVQSQLDLIEGQITGIKTRNGMALSANALPTTTSSGAYDAQIASLQTENRQLLSQSRKVGKDPMVAAAEAQLAALRSTYSENHPDVVRAKQRLKELQDLAAADGPPPDVAIISSQIEANNRQIAALQALKSSDAARTSSTLSAQSRAPAILEQVMQLDNQANGLRLQLQDISTNILKAQNSARMAREQKGEHLQVVDAPELPDTPVWPNRPLLMAGGLGGGLGLGLLLALALEFLASPIRGVEQLKAMGLTPLAVVPTLRPEQEQGFFARLRGAGRKLALEDDLD